MSATAQSFVAADLLKHRSIPKLIAAIAGDLAICSVKRALEEEDGYDNTLWGFYPSRQSWARQLTPSGVSSTSPALNSDGSKLAFLSDRDKSGKQIHLLSLDGGEAIKITDSAEPSLVAIEAWAPDGASVLVTADITWKEDGEETSSKRGRPPQVARYLPYKLDGSGITVGYRTHLYRADIETGEMHALTSGDFDVSNGAWSSRGDQLAFVRKRSGRQRHRSDLWIARSDGKEPRLLVDQLASISRFAWSPDGRYIAVAGSEREGESQVGLWVVDVHSGRLERIGGQDFEIEPSGLVWHSSGCKLAVVSAMRGLGRLALVSIPDGEVSLVRRGLSSLWALAGCGDRLVFLAASMRKLEEVFSVDWQGKQERRHTAFNREWFARLPSPRVAKRKFAVPDGAGGTERIEAWILKPAEGDGPFPLLVDMHGGPHSTVLVDFAAHVYWYLLLAKGWAIVAPNAVGSTSYGRKFADRLRGCWGELDMPQYEAVIRTLQSEGIADDRIACAGKSYGGFLSAWSIGHSKLFKAAAVAAPVANIESHAGTSDTGYYVTPFAMGGEITQVRDRYQRLSPVGYCGRVEAATLILQGENDGRCPRGQSEELFANLIRCSDAPVELVIYPESTHSEAEAGRPTNRIDYHARLTTWLTKYVEKAGDRT